MLVPEQNKNEPLLYEYMQSHGKDVLWRTENEGFRGLFDQRRRRPSWKRVPAGETERILGLYRDKYFRS